MMVLTTWMKKCAVAIQIRIKHVSKEGNVMRFFWERMCWRSSTTVGFCNDVEHVGP